MPFPNHVQKEEDEMKDTFYDSITYEYSNIYTKLSCYETKYVHITGKEELTYGYIKKYLIFYQ